MEDIWKCPKCGAVLQKGAPWMADVIKRGGMVSGAATCGNCHATFSQYDVYSGKYDVGSGSRGSFTRKSTGKKWWQFWK